MRYLQERGGLYEILRINRFEWRNEESEGQLLLFFISINIEHLSPQTYVVKKKEIHISHTYGSLQWCTSISIIFVTLFQLCHFTPLLPQLYMLFYSWPYTSLPSIHAHSTFTHTAPSLILLSQITNSVVYRGIPVTCKITDTLSPSESEIYRYRLVKIKSEQLTL